MKIAIGFFFFLFFYGQLAFIGLFCPDDRSLLEYIRDIKESIGDVWEDRKYIFTDNF